VFYANMKKKKLPSYVCECGSFKGKKNIYKDGKSPWTVSFIFCACGNLMLDLGWLLVFRENRRCFG
jgi:hypothetical protein